MLCGSLSLTDLHPGHSTINMKTTVYPSTVFVLHAQYMIEDKATGMKTGMERTVHSIILSTSWIDEGSKFGMAVHEVQTVKHKQISVVVDKPPACQHKFLVLDGPGYFCRKIELSKNIFHSQTFHLLLASLVHSSCQAQVQFGDQSIPLIPIEHGEGIKFMKLPHKSLCNVKMCAFVFFSDQNRQLNITVHSIKYIGENEENCKYGGVTTAQYLKNKYVEDVIICKSTERAAGIRRSFYSTNSTLLLFLFWFEPHSRITAELSIRTTDCKFVHVCPCALANGAKLSTTF